MSFLKRFGNRTEKKTKLEQLYIEHGQVMFKMAYWILNDKHLAEDAVQDAFIKLSRNTSKFDEVKSKETRNYLLVTVRSTSYDILRKRNLSNNKNEPWFSVDKETEPPVDQEKNTEELYISEEGCRQIIDEIKALPEIYGDTFFMKYSLDYSNEEIAKELGITQENVRKRLQVARQKLAKKLKKREGGDGK